MNCREFENEFGDRTDLSDAAKLHLQKCRDCRKLEAAQTHLWRVIDGLPVVDAPNNFNFRLKGKLATANASDFRPAWWKSLHFVAPISAMVLLAFLIFASQNFFVSSPEIAGVMVDKTAAPPPKIEANPANSTAAENPAPNPEIFNQPSDNNTQATTNESEIPPTYVVENPTRKNNNLPDSRRERQNSSIVSPDEDGSSRTSSVTTAPVIQPPGTEIKRVETPPDLINGQKLTAAEILKTIGIEVEDAKMPPRVKSVTAKSLAEISGIEDGDIIEAIDEIPLNNAAAAPTLSGVKKLKVRRDNKIIEITLKAN